MKECKYCRSLYEDNLSICPICGGNKVITEEERMEEVILRQKEQEFRERMDNERRAQKKKFLAILVALVIIALAGIGIGFYNANKPLSNGMTQDEGAALLARGVAYYESSDYESAIECFVQLPADSKQYKEAQNTLEKAIASYVPAVLRKADKYIQNAEYEVAMELLQNAQTLVPENEELKNAYDAVFDTYKVVICSIAMDEAGVFVANGDYENAIVSLNMALDKIGHDDELLAKRSVIENEYVFSVISTAEDQYIEFNAESIYAAEKTIQNALNVLPENRMLLDELQRYEDLEPIALFQFPASSERYTSGAFSPVGTIRDVYGVEHPNAYRVERFAFETGMSGMWSSIPDDIREIGGNWLFCYKTVDLDFQYSKITGTLMQSAKYSDAAVTTRFVISCLDVDHKPYLLSAVKVSGQENKVIEFEADVTNTKYVIFDFIGDTRVGNETDPYDYAYISELYLWR